MKKFNKKIIFYTILFGLCFILKLFFLSWTTTKNSNRYFLKGNSKSFFLGDSHIETGIKEFEGIRNLGKGAQPLFFTCIQAEEIINSSNRPTVIIGLDNFVVLHKNRFGTDATNYFMNKYFIYFNLNDHRRVFMESPKLWISHFFGIGKKRIPKLYDEVGFAPKVNDTFQKAINIVPKDLNEFSYNHIHTKKLIELIQNNPATKFILLRTPLLLNEIDIKSFQIAEKFFIQKVSSITQEFSNVMFLDFKDEFKNQKELFFDPDHLNSRGADSLEIRLKKIF
jgi:hypothetical protein